MNATVCEFEFDTATIPADALDLIDQGNEVTFAPLADDCLESASDIPAAPPAPHPHPVPDSTPLFTGEVLFTLQDDEQSPEIEQAGIIMTVPDYDAADVTPAVHASPVSVATTSSNTPAPAPAALAPAAPLTRRQKLTLEVEGLESQIVEYSETEFELSEKVSQVRKWRKEALEQLRSLRWQLNAMSDEDAEKPVETTVKFTGKIDGVEIGSATLTEKQLATAAAAIVGSPTIDHGGAQPLTALGVTPKQLEKFEIEGIRTVAQFERALANRDIENVRGIQERTMDKLREALWEFRKANPIPDPDDRPVQTASEGATIEKAPEHQPEPKATEPVESNYAAIREAGRIAGLTGLHKSENPIKDSPFRASYWDDGWDDGYAERLAKSVANNAIEAPAKATEQTEASDGQAPKKRGRKPKATKPE